MEELILHDLTRAAITRQVAAASHAILIIGASGIGKGSIAQVLAAKLLDIPLESLASYAYMRHLTPGTEKSISIEAIRGLDHFLSLRTPGNTKRIVIIENAGSLTAEAQNALLKTLEEPPEGTTLILTAVSERAVLPTIRSRVSLLTVQRPSPQALTQHFTDSSFTESTVRQAYLMSGGLPGLMHAVLHEDVNHSLVEAATVARQIIQKPLFERLAMVDSLSKDRGGLGNVLEMLQQMAQVALTTSKSADSWHNILVRSYEASEQLAGNAQPKLVLTNLMLNL